MRDVRTLPGVPAVLGAPPALLFGAAAAVAGALGWAARRRVAAALLRLERPTHGVAVQLGQPLDVGDGVHLATDVYQPVTGWRRRPAPAGPTLLVRTPYGRSGASGLLAVSMARRFAERGYRVVVQDVRGRFGSDGEFTPYIYERSDGAATAAWILEQPWSDGRIVTWGPSYLGYTQWALVAADEPAAVADQPVAMVPITTAANIGGPEGDEAVALETTLRWVVTIDAMVNRSLGRVERMRRLAHPAHQERLLAPGFSSVPLAGADEVVLGRAAPVWQKYVENARRGDPLWNTADLSDAVGTTETRVHAVGGWDDLFLTRQLDDHARLVAAGRDPHLTIGPWHHLDPRMQLEALRLGLDWFAAHLRGETHRLRRLPVRVWVGGVEEWRDLPEWPPPTEPLRHHLGPAGRLSSAVPHPATFPEDSETSFHYDPAHPTPSLGGAILSVEAGSVDNRPLEARDDVVTFTSEPLATDVEVLGRGCARLWVSASGAHHDIVVRLCEVHPDGASMNLADGFLRLRHLDDPAEPVLVEVPLAPIAQRLRAGRRIRLQVSGGAHPRIARNLGTGETALRGTTMRATTITVHHDPDHSSSLDLPVANV